MIAGFEEPTPGKVLIDGDDVAGLPALQAPDQHRLPELRALPAPQRRRQRRLRPQAQGRREGGDQAPGRGRARAGRPRRRDQPAAEPALRRAAAAGRARPRPGEPAEGPAPRRAARRPRPEAPQGPPGRAQADPARGRDHLRLRHPRPGGGAHDVRPDRGHEPRPGRADRRARGGLRAAGDDLRRRLHRRLEPDAGRRRGRDRRTDAVRLDAGVEVEARGQQPRPGRALPRGRPPREASHRPTGATRSKTGGRRSRGWSRPPSTWARRRRSSSVCRATCR